MVKKQIFCKQCGKEKFVSPSRKTEFCSKSCASLYRKGGIRVSISEQNRRYREKAKPKIKVYMREYARKNREKFNQTQRNWREKNKDKVKEYSSIQKIKDKMKVKARNKVYRFKMRDDKCCECGSTDNLEFHHTNYKLNEGFTVCIKCHGKLHRKY